MRWFARLFTGMIVAVVGPSEVGAAPPESAPSKRPVLTGFWAARQTTTALVKLPVLGEMTSKTVAISMLRVRQNGARLEILERVCELRTDVPGPVETVYPRTFLAAVSGKKKSAEIIERDGRFFYEEPSRVRVLGAKLARPEEEALPTEAKDPRLTDPDEDGKPGITVAIEGFVAGRIYVVQRDRSRLRGVIVAADDVRGTVQWQSEQVVVGATSPMLETAPKSRPHLDPALNTFRMRRVPRNATCRGVLQREGMLFDAD